MQTSVAATTAGVNVATAVCGNIRQHGGYPPAVDSLLDRMEQVLSRRGFSAREWARRSGLAEQHVSTILMRLRKNPDANIGLPTVEALANGANVSAAWLASGSGSPDGFDAPPPDDHAHPPAPPSDGYDDPRFNALPNWPELLAGARRAAPSTPAWVWDGVARSRPMMTTVPTVRMVVAAAKLVEEYGTPPAGAVRGKR